MVDPLQPVAVPELVRPFVSWNEGRSGYPASFLSHYVMPRRNFKSIIMEKA